VLRIALALSLYVGILRASVFDKTRASRDEDFLLDALLLWKIVEKIFKYE
jgi:hypothetical protein